MIDYLLSQLAPHLCYECGKIGSILCDYCKYDIVSNGFSTCITCPLPTEENNICLTCQGDISRAWCVGERTETLRRVIDDYKFERVYAAHAALAQLLAQRLPMLPKECVIVPIPTIAPHIRQRGYDHTLLIARKLAKLKGIKVESALSRKDSSTQRDKTKKERLAQAAQAFGVKSSVENKIVLLLDDIVTTGATLQSAASLLKKNGAKEVWAAVVARQPLDK